METPKTKGGEYDFWGPRSYVFNTYWRLTLLSVQRQRSRGIWGLKLFLRDTLQHISSSFVKRFEYLAGMYHCVWMFQVKRKYCCYDYKKYLIEFEIFTWRLLKISFPGSRFQHSFLGEETPRGLRLWRSQYFLLLRNIGWQYEHPSLNPSYAPIS